MEIEIMDKEKAKPPKGTVGGGRKHGQKNLSEIMDKEKAKPPKGTVGGGRKHGQKNLSVGETKREIKSFFQELTIDSMRWRQNVRRHLETAYDAREFRFWSTIALSYRFGVPGKMAEEGVQREPMVFATTHGYQSWDPRAPGAAEMNARSQRMIEAKSEELKVAALEAKGEVIEVEKTADAEVPETLESVDPNAFGGGGSRR
jgi:hypothetical protein